MLYARKNTHDTQKGFALGLLIGAAAAVVLSSKKVRNRINQSVPEQSKEKLKQLKSGADVQTDKAKQKVAEAKEKVAEKNKS